MIIKNEYKPKFATNWIKARFTYNGVSELNDCIIPIESFISEIMSSDLKDSGINIIIRETETKDIGNGNIIAFNNIPCSLIVNSDIPKETKERISNMFRSYFKQFS